MNYVEHFNLFGVPAKEIPCITGEGAPTTSTEGVPGCLYMDNLTGVLYKCIMVSAGMFVWESVLSDSHVINVKDFGAVGDGVTNDEVAIKNAFTYALTCLPCEVYFPKGEYGILNGGITVAMPLGSGGLSVRGDGNGLSVIKFLPDWKTNGSWYALRFWPIGRPNSSPKTEEEWLHDISITGLAVYDTDPIAHAWNTAKGDRSKEETHGFDIQYCKRCSVTGCNIINVGDEAIDIYSCRDAIISGNYVEGSPGAGSAGGAISIGDGSSAVVVSNNNVNSSAVNEVVTAGTILPAGTILAVDVVSSAGATVPSGTTLTEPLELGEDMVLVKSNYGIAVESLYMPVTDIVIEGNTIRNINGSGISIAATNSGAEVCGVTVSGNIISQCSRGVLIQGTIIKHNVCVSSNVIRDCSDNGLDVESAADIIVSDCVLDTIGGVAIRFRNGNAASTCAPCVQGCTIKNIQKQAVFISGPCRIMNCFIDTVGLNGVNEGGAIYGYNAAYQLEVINTKLYNVKINKGVFNATKLVDVDVAFDLDGTGDAYAGACLKHVRGGVINGRVANIVNSAIIDGLSIESSKNLWKSPIILANVTGVTVTNCHINVPGYSAIEETGTSNMNIIANNVSNRGYTIIGAGSVNQNNITVTI